MASDYNKDDLFSKRVKAGKRTYFFDVKATRNEDYFLTITESKRKPRDDGEGFYYEKHKIFLYKEDFYKFAKALNESVEHIKEELLPDEDFSQYENDEDDEEEDEW